MSTTITIARIRDLSESDIDAAFDLLGVPATVEVRDDSGEVTGQQTNPDREPVTAALLAKDGPALLKTGIGRGLFTGNRLSTIWSEQTDDGWFLVQSDPLTPVQMQAIAMLAEIKVADDGFVCNGRDPESIRRVHQEWRAMTATERSW